MYAVIGGVIGAVLTMVAGSFSPLGAQSEVNDAEFGTIICRQIKVVTPGNEAVFHVRIAENIVVNDGSVLVKSKAGSALMSTTEHGGLVAVRGKGDSGAVMCTTERGGEVLLQGKEDDDGAALMTVDEHGGGYLAVFGKENDNSNGEVKIGINKYGTGAVSTWDKNGKRVATLK